MTDTFSPRTVAIVAVASLVAGFVAVFGGGMIALRGPAQALPPEVDGGAVAPPPAPRSSAPGEADAGRSPPGAVGPVAPDDAAGAGANPVEAGDGGGAGGSSAQVGQGVPSRCWDQGNPAVINAAGCDRLPGVDAHLQSRASAIAGCARGHGRLAYIMDFRFSTGFVRSWGGPSSTIADAGTVVACVRRVTQPIPFAGMTHAHDRYLVVVPIEW